MAGTPVRGMPGRGKRRSGGIRRLPARFATARFAEPVQVKGLVRWVFSDARNPVTPCADLRQLAGVGVAKPLDEQIERFD